MKSATSTIKAQPRHSSLAQLKCLKHAEAQVNWHTDDTWVWVFWQPLESSLQAQGFVQEEEDLQRLLRWTSAFCRVLMWHIREECDLRAELEVMP